MGNEYGSVDIRHGEWAQLRREARIDRLNSILIETEDDLYHTSIVLEKTEKERDRLRSVLLGLGLPVERVNALQSGEVVAGDVS